MARLYLFAEGTTEQTFADTVLKPHLANYGVYLNKPVLIAHARRKGKVHRGGGRKFEPMQNDIRRFLKQDSAQDVYFTTMIDLYAIAPQFPGLDEANRLTGDPQLKVQALESSWSAHTNDHRFIPYIQLHEYEAYLFVDIDLLTRFFENTEKDIETLRAVAEQVDNPELINDGPDTAPSKRIIQAIPQYDSAKTTVGAQMAELIGLPRIRECCPHFNDWVTKLEQLGQG